MSSFFAETEMRVLVDADGTVIMDGPRTPDRGVSTSESVRLTVGVGVTFTGEKNV